MDELQYKGIWDYCHKKDCQYYDICGLAVTDSVIKEAADKGMKISKKEFCVDFKKPLETD